MLKIAAPLREEASRQPAPVSIHGWRPSSSLTAHGEPFQGQGREYGLPEVREVRACLPPQELDECPCGGGDRGTDGSGFEERVGHPRARQAPCALSSVATALEDSRSTRERSMMMCLAPSRTRLCSSHRSSGSPSTTVSSLSITRAQDDRADSPGSWQGHLRRALQRPAFPQHRDHRGPSTRRGHDPAVPWVIGVRCQLRAGLFDRRRSLLVPRDTRQQELHESHGFHAGLKSGWSAYGRARARIDVSSASTIPRWLLTDSSSSGRSGPRAT